MIHPLLVLPLVEIAISTNRKPNIQMNRFENTGHVWKMRIGTENGGLRYNKNKNLTLSARGPSLDVRIWRLKTVPALKY